MTVYAIYPIKGKTHIAKEETVGTEYVVAVCGKKFKRIDVDLRSYHGASTCKRCNMVHNYVNVLNKMVEIGE